MRNATQKPEHNKKRITKKMPMWSDRTAQSSAAVQKENWKCHI